VVPETSALKNVRMPDASQAPDVSPQGKFVLCDLATYAAAVWPVEFLVMRK